MLQRGVGPDVGGGAAADSVLRASIDSLGTTVDSLSGALSAVPDAGGGWATGLQVIATVIAAAAAVASWRSVTVSERASTRAQQRDDEERAWRLQGVRHVYYAATVRTPVHDAVRSFRSEAKGLFAREVEVFARLDELSDDANERAVEALDDYLHLHHQPFADAVAEAATAWDESPELGVELQGACAAMEEEVAEECSRLPLREASPSFSAIIDRHVGAVLKLVKEADPALASAPLSPGEPPSSSA